VKAGFSRAYLDRVRRGFLPLSRSFAGILQHYHRVLPAQSRPDGGCSPGETTRHGAGRCAGGGYRRLLLGPAHGPEQRLAAFFQALYTLAPRLLVPETTSRQPELVLGNFHMRPDLGQLEREHGLKLIKDYGGGVRLFRRGGN